MLYRLAQTGPAKCYQDILCYHWYDRSIAYISQVACPTFFLSRQRDIMASFSFGTCAFSRFLKVLNIFVNTLLRDLFCEIVYTKCFHVYHDLSKTEAWQLWLCYGHIWLTLQMHACCEKGVGTDPCVLKKYGELCNSLTSTQKSQLDTPS